MQTCIATIEEEKKLHFLEGFDTNICLALALAIGIGYRIQMTEFLSYKKFAYGFWMFLDQCYYL